LALALWFFLSRSVLSLPSLSWGLYTIVSPLLSITFIQTFALYNSRAQENEEEEVRLEKNKHLFRVEIEKNLFSVIDKVQMGEKGSSNEKFSYQISSLFLFLSLVLVLGGPLARLRINKANK
jgi:hypothetical protein